MVIATITKCNNVWVQSVQSTCLNINESTERCGRIFMTFREEDRAFLFYNFISSHRNGRTEIFGSVQIIMSLIVALMLLLALNSKQKIVI